MAETTPETTRSVWRIDPNESQINFRLEFLTLTTASGAVRNFQGVIHYDEGEPTRSSVEATIDPRSIETGDPTRDAHLRSPDFFDVERFPTIVFRSRKIVGQGGPHYEVVGDLTVRDITREVTLAVTYQGESIDFAGRRHAEFNARATVAPADFGLSWNADLAAGWIPVGDRGTIVIHVEAIRAVPNTYQRS